MRSTASLQPQNTSNYYTPASPGGIMHMTFLALWACQTQPAFHLKSIFLGWNAHEVFITSTRLVGCLCITVKQFRFYINFHHLHTALGPSAHPFLNYSQTSHPIAFVHTSQERPKPEPCNDASHVFVHLSTFFAHFTLLPLRLISHDIWLATQRTTYGNRQ